MKKTLMTSLLATGLIVGNAQQPAIPRDEKVERQVEQTLARLSLDEKIGQMCELTIDVITDGQSPEFRLNEDALKKVFGRYHVGSILNVPKGVAQRPEVWSSLIRRLNQISAETSSGVPQIYGVDQIHGASYTWGQPSFRKRLVRRHPSTARYPGESAR